MATLTSKELTALEEQMTSEQAVVNKFRMYAQTTTDTQIKSKCEEIAGKHQKHFDQLMTYLQ